MRWNAMKSPSFHAACGLQWCAPHRCWFRGAIDLPGRPNGPRNSGTSAIRAVAIPAMRRTPIRSSSASERFTMLSGFAATVIRSSGLPALQSGSAARCALFLGATALAALSICLCMPGARSALLPLSGRGTGNLVMISSSGFAGTRAPSIRFADYQEWTTDTAALFTEIAFYRPTAKSVHLPRRPAARLSIAQASDNLLQLLNLPVAHAGPSVAEPGQSRLILTRSAWQRILRRRSLPCRPDRRHRWPACADCGRDARQQLALCRPHRRGAA